MSWAAFVNVLKHPALFPIEFVPHEGGGDSVAAGDLRTLRVAKPGVTGLQFAQHVLNLPLELFVSTASENLILSSFGQFFPIRPIHARIEVLTRHELAHARINLLFRLQVEAHWSLNGIGDPPSPTKTKAAQ